MSPDKLFDYLDGKLSPADRDEVENKLIDEQISLAAPSAEWSHLTTSIVDAASACGGSAVAEPPSETSVIVMAHLPRDRYGEFRQKLLGAGSVTSPPTPTASPADAAGFET